MAGNSIHGAIREWLRVLVKPVTPFWGKNECGLAVVDVFPNNSSEGAGLRFRLSQLYSQIFTDSIFSGGLHWTHGDPFGKWTANYKALSSQHACLFGQFLQIELIKILRRQWGWGWGGGSWGVCRLPCSTIPILIQRDKSAFLTPRPWCLVLYVLNIFDKHFRISEDLRGCSCIHEGNNLLAHYAVVHRPALHLCDEKRKHWTLFVFISEQQFFFPLASQQQIAFKRSTLIHHLNDCTFSMFLCCENTPQTFIALMFVHTGCNITVYVSEDIWAVNFLQLHSRMDGGTLKLWYDMYWFGTAGSHTWLPIICL